MSDSIVQPPVRQPRPATVGERTAATIGNLLVGALPLVIPDTLIGLRSYESPEEQLVAITALTVSMALAQWVFVHIWRGSPGYVIAGLRIQTTSGGRPSVKTTAIRGVPFLAALVAMLLMHQPATADSAVVSMTVVLLLFAAVALLLASGIFLLFNRSQSIIDRISGTEVIKVYWVFAYLR